VFYTFTSIIPKSDRFHSKDLAVIEDIIKNIIEFPTQTVLIVQKSTKNHLKAIINTLSILERSIYTNSDGLQKAIAHTILTK